MTMSCGRPASGWPAAGVNATLAATDAACDLSARSTSVVVVSDKPSLTVSAPATVTACAKAIIVRFAYTVSSSSSVPVAVNVTSSATSVKCNASSASGEGLAYYVVRYNLAV